MYGTNVLDKDGISAASVMAEMAAYLQRKGLTLTEQLHKLYHRLVMTTQKRCQTIDKEQIKAVS